MMQYWDWEEWVNFFCQIIIFIVIIAVLATFIVCMIKECKMEKIKHEKMMKLMDSELEGKNNEKNS